MARRRRKRRRRNVQLRVTLAGWSFLLMSLLVGLAAVRSHMPMMFVLFGVMLTVMLISSILSRGMIRALGVQRAIPPRAWQCETLHFGYFIRNLRRRGASLGIKLSEHKPKGIKGINGYCVHLPPQTTFRAGSRLAAYRRGPIKLAAVRLSTQFPFGLLDVHRKHVQPASLMVWPAKGRIKTELLLGGAAQSSSAPPSRQQGGQDEFFGLRDYRQGDNPRWIHWRRSAGRIHPVVREMARPVPDSLMVIVDPRLADAGPRTTARRETRLQFAATLIEHALHRGYLAGLAMAGRDAPVVLRPANGLAARCDMLDALAEVGDGPFDDLDATIAAIEPACLRHAQVLVVTENQDDLSGASRHRLQSQGRQLRLIDAATMQSIFEPNPHLTDVEENA